MKPDEIALAKAFRERGWIREWSTAGKTPTDALTIELNIPIERAIQILADWTARGWYVPKDVGRMFDPRLVGIGRGWLTKDGLEAIEAEAARCKAKATSPKA